MKSILELFSRPRPATPAVIPVVDPATAMQVPQFEIRIVEPCVTDGNVSLFELFTISALVRLRKPQTIFEFGTFNGRTTVNLAANASGSTKVFTLDLPRTSLEKTRYSLAEMEKKYVDKSETGARYANYPEAERIIQLYGDSARFDFSAYENTVDFVFVDASHAYEYVLNDSKIALRLLRDGKGTILWHDYGRPYWWPGVTDGLNELYRQAGDFAKLIHLEGTSLVCLMRD